MLKRLLLPWFFANFALVGLLSWISGRWYLSWSPQPLAGMVAQAGLIHLPNLLLPILVLRSGWPAANSDLRTALGWRWAGWRTLSAGLAAFGLAWALSALVAQLVGPPIPYSLPGSTPIQAAEPASAIVLLLFLTLWVALTVLGEETMFRGLIQTRLAQRYHAPVAIIGPALLFALRHLPDDLFYARAWNATPAMWLSRWLQLSSGAILFSLARRFGRSTYASALMHALLFLPILFGG